MNERELLKILNQSVNKKKDGKFSKKIIALIIMLNVIFTGFVFYVFLKVGNEPTTLIVAFFGFTTGELFLLASIKKTEVKEDNCNE